MDVVTQPSVRGRGNRWRLTIISFHLFRFPAPPYQPAASSVIRHKDTIATIRGCAEARGDRNVLFVWNVFSPSPTLWLGKMPNTLVKIKMDFFYFLCPSWFDLSTNGGGGLQKGGASKRTQSLWHSAFSSAPINGEHWRRGGTPESPPRKSTATHLHVTAVNVVVGE